MSSLFLKPSDPLLKKVSKAVSISEISSKEVKDIILKMLKIAFGERKDHKKPIMVGLAAPQIGILKRIILVVVRGKLKIYINPKIIWRSKKAEEWAEGCYSTGKICGIVSRPVSIKIQGFSLQAKLVTEKHTGFVARIFQHEIDHLGGKVFIHLIKDPDKLHLVSKKDFPKYRRGEAWRNWPKKLKDH